MDLEPEPESPEVTLNAPIYSAKQIRGGTFIGGPLIAGYFIAENYKVFGDFRKAKIAWMYAIAITVLIIGALFLVPNDIDIPEYIIPFIYSWVAYYVVQYFQEGHITDHINSGEKVFGWGRVLLIGLIGALVTVFFLILTIFIANIIRYYI